MSQEEELLWELSPPAALQNLSTDVRDEQGEK